MFDTESVFHVLAADDVDHRVAQRRALALAQTRLDNTLGRFLRGSVTTEEFQTRFAACEDEFALHVAEACAEMGCEEPEHIAKVLADNYYRGRRWQPIAQDIGEEIDPGEMQDSNDGKPVNEPHQDDEDEKAPKTKWSGVGLDPNMGPGGPQDPWGAQDVDPYTCQGCGQQSVEYAQQGVCPHCGTRRGQPTHMAAEKTAESGNTDLGGPEPVIDKRLWEPKNLGDPEVEDGMWPTVRKDVTEVIGPPNNKSELKEHEGHGTEHQTLPSNSGDAGFDAGGPGPAPHTDTWSGTGDLATPVTRQAQPE